MHQLSLRRRSGSMVTFVAMLMMAAAIAVVAPPPAHAASFTVSNNNPFGPGSFRQALQDANAAGGLSNVINFAGAPQTLTVTGPTIAWGGSSALTINGGGWTLQGDGTDTNGLFATGIVTTAAVTVNNLRFVSGLGTAGGGISHGGSGPLTVNDSTFVANRSDQGGAIYSAQPVTITNSVFDGNTAETGPSEGGAIYVILSGTSVTDSTFVDNRSGDGGVYRGGSIDFERSRAVDNRSSNDGGVIYVEGGASVNVTYSELDGNRADESGGAVSHAGNGLVTIDGSTIAGNEADQGGGVAAPGVDVVNSTVFGNVAREEGGTPGAGGGLLATTSTIDLDHATVVGNEVEGVTPGGANVDAEAQLATKNSVIADPIGGANCVTGGGTVTQGGNWSDDAACALSDADDFDDQPGAPRLGPARNNGGADTGAEVAPPARPTRTMFPLLGSPLVDALSFGQCSQFVDQRNVTRPYGDGCDIGATEAVFPPHGFGDVSDFYDPTVRWSTSDVNDPSVQNGFPGNNTWRQGNNITRYQTVFMLHNEAGAPGGNPPHGLSDVQPFFEQAVRWAVENDVFTGYNDDTFRGGLSITRAQLTKGKWGFAGQPGGAPAHGFDDVADGGFFDAAIRWAKHNNLVNGFNDNTFRPDRAITRGNATRIDYQLAQNPDAWQDPDTAPSVMLFRPNTG